VNRRLTKPKTNSAATPALPAPFAGWFERRGWTPRAHQLALLAHAQAGRSSLLVAPTGAGKTLAGFLGSLTELALLPADRPHRLHTLYVSPLKALSSDVHRNLMGPVEEMGLGLRIETRTGDTPQSKRQRQRSFPPDILLTTPEQVCLLMASPYARAFFEDLACVIIDEAHALAPGKRGDLLALALERLRCFAPRHRRVGLSATIADPAVLARWIDLDCAIVTAAGGAAAIVDVLDTDARIPWAGHSGRHAMGDVYAAIKSARTALVFVNTRAQAELTFQELWRINDDNLAIALHHGSLDVEQRRRVESAMTQSKLRAVVCTSTLDLGIDWGDVDLVIQMGAPKGASRLLQRIGRANHRLDEPSRALLAPTNRFEVLECRAAKDAVAEGAQDALAARNGSLDALCQHIMGCACGEPFHSDDLYAEVIRAAPFEALSRADFDACVAFVADGGYALRAYDRFRRIVQDPKTQLWRARNPAIAQQHRLNVGAIVEEPMLDVRLTARMRRTRAGSEGPGSPGQGPALPGKKLGQIEEYFIEGLSPGDTFLFAGEILRFEALQETSALVTRATGHEAPKIPSYAGGKFPLSTYLAARVRQMLADRKRWRDLPDQVREWLELQRLWSIVPKAEQLLVETFPRAGKHYLVCYPFEGRLAHQTLGMLLTRRLERAGLHPLGFVASEYALSVWGMQAMDGVNMDALFDADMLGDDLDAWLAESALMKRTFRTCAVIAGMIARRQPGAEKTGRQVTFSTDLIYDVLRTHEPDHVLLRAALSDAGEGLLDIHRLNAALVRIAGRIVHKSLPRLSPFATPVMLEIGREAIAGAADEAILAAAGAELIAEAIG